MNTSAEVILKWGDGEYLFALKLKQVEELQRQCGAGIGTIFHRFMTREMYVADIYHTIRLGLIGGGMPPTEALDKVNAYVDGQPIDKDDDKSSPLKTAQAILLALWEGMNEIEVPDTGKPRAGATEDGSTSRPSGESSSNSPSTQEPATP